MARRDNDRLVMNIVDSQADLKVRLHTYDLTVCFSTGSYRLDADRPGPDALLTLSPAVLIWNGALRTTPSTSDVKR
jgi:hypothetical protein